MIKILYIGRHPEILETVLRLINNNENWFGIGAATNEEAISIFAKQEFNLVLLGCGIDEESENELISNFRLLRPSIPIIQHYGGGSGLLKNEILCAIQSQ